MKRMISGLVAVTLLGGVGALDRVARADEVVITPPPPPYYRRYRREHYFYSRPGLRLERAGIALSVMGSVLGVVGSAVAATAWNNHNGNWTPGVTLGAALAIPGAVMLGAGIPMIIVGDAEGRRRVEMSVGPAGIVGHF